MTREEKKLLYKDLSARQPYRPFICFAGKLTMPFLDVIASTESNELMSINGLNPEDVKPYLRLMSSMTKKEAIEMLSTIINTDGVVGCEIEKDKFKFRFKNNTGHFSCFTVIFFNTIYCLKQLDWLNEHHFDYRGLIEKGLALEAPKDMYKTE